MKLTKTAALAVLPVDVILGAQVVEAATTLSCTHEPSGDGDPHSGIHPNPGVDHWPTTGESSAHLALQQFLFMSMAHWEDALGAVAGNNPA